MITFEAERREDERIVDERIVDAMVDAVERAVRRVAEKHLCEWDAIDEVGVEDWAPWRGATRKLLRKIMLSAGY